MPTIPPSIRPGSRSPRKMHPNAPDNPKIKLFTIQASISSTPSDTAHAFLIRAEGGNVAVGTDINTWIHEPGCQSSQNTPRHRSVVTLSTRITPRAAEVSAREGHLCTYFRGGERDSTVESCHANETSRLSREILWRLGTWTKRESLCLTFTTYYLIYIHTARHTLI